MGLIRQEFTAVDDKGIPTEPKDFVVGYANQVSAILRNTVTINTGCLKAPEQSHYRELLFRKLHARYVFPGEEEKRYNNNDLKGNPVNKAALKIMTKALARWKNRVRTLIFKEKLSYEQLVKREPLVKEEDYKAFVARCETDAAIAKSKRGKELYAMNIGRHHLGSGGYRTAVPKWAKEDAAAIARGEEPPFAGITEPQAKNFVRARCQKPKGSASYSAPADQKVKNFIEFYVSPVPQMKSMNRILTKLMKSNISNIMLRVPYAQDRESNSSSSQGSTPVAPWDTTFNRALNLTKEVDRQAKPSSAGRVPGFGAVPWSEYYGSSKGKKAESADVKALREQVAQIPQLIQEAATAAAEKERERVASQVNEQVTEKLNAILPVYFQQYENWKKAGRRGPPPVPSLGSAGSDNQQVLVTPPAPEGAPDMNLSGILKGRPAGAAPAGSHSATCPPADGVVTPLAVLNKLKVAD